MAPGGCSATRCRRARVVGALLASTASLAAAGPAKASRKLTGYVMDDGTIRTAVAAWFDDRSGAEATYGHISTWETGGVTSMAELFCAWGCSYSNSAAASFNEDIGAWDTSGVATMIYMFLYASAFDQDLGWCVEDDVDLRWAFEDTPCASTSCGIVQAENSGDCDVASTGNVMVNHKLRWAVSAWLADPTAAEATYGHISTWDTSRVTDMAWLFCGASWSACNTAAASFNEDIGAWDTSAVTRMSYMFYRASAFNQDISGWAVHSAWDMSWMFGGASAFDQDLGWCVGDGVDLEGAFSETQCESTSCGVYYSAALRCGGTPMTDRSIRAAVAAWISDATAAEATYGHISTWATGGVTDMEGLFDVDYNSGAASFNEDISAWDTSSVTTMQYTFYGAETFNQDLGDWAVHSVTNMAYMFYGASAFEQDLGWCVGDAVGLDYAFYDTPCESTACGIVGGVDCDVMGDGNVMVNWKIRWAVAAWLADASAAEATYGHISTWATGGVTDMSMLFCADDSFCYYSNDAASSFNEDIGAWDTSGVTTMYYMFEGASAFDQDLGWCVGDGMFDYNGWEYTIQDAFDDTPCESTSCGVMVETNTGDCDVPPTGNVMVNWKIKQAVAAWLSDASAAEATYGHISTWETSGVTDMTSLFLHTAFNEDIAAWDTSGVTTMYLMFYEASAFDQNLGWCVDVGVYLWGAFVGTPCESTSCGVKQVAGGCAPSPAPTSPTPIVDAAQRLSGVSWLLTLTLL